MKRHEQRSIELLTLANGFAFYRDQLGILYDKHKNHMDLLSCDQLGRILMRMDTILIELRTAQTLAINGTPARFNQSEADMLDELQKTYEQIEQRERNVEQYQKSLELVKRNKVVPFDGSNNVFYVGGIFDPKEPA